MKDKIGVGEKKLVNIGWLSADEQMEIKTAKEKFITTEAFGERVSDRIFIMGIIRMYSLGKM